jgi:TRAP-type C4-dicarboxylate transport system, periplasmic component
VVHGVAIPWEVTLPFRIPERTDALTEFDCDRGLYTAAFAMVMNRDAYDALPDDLKAVIYANSGPETAAKFGAAMDSVDIIGRERAAESGNTIVVLPPEEVARWREAAQPAYARWIASVDDRGLDGAALVDRATALVAEESGE